MAIRVLSFYDQEQTGPNVSQYGDCDAGLTVLDNGKGYAEAAKASADAAKISETNAAISAEQAQQAAISAQNAAGSVSEDATAAKAAAAQAAASAEEAKDAAEVAVNASKDIPDLVKQAQQSAADAAGSAKSASDAASTVKADAAQAASSAATANQAAMDAKQTAEGIEADFSKVPKSATLNVGGDKNTYYPVLFGRNLNRGPFYLTRHVHQDGSWKGSVFVAIDGIGAGWGGNSRFVSIKGTQRSGGDPKELKPIGGYGLTYYGDSIVVYLAGDRNYDLGNILDMPTVYLNGFTDEGGSETGESFPPITSPYGGKYTQLKDLEVLNVENYVDFPYNWTNVEAQRTKGTTYTNPYGQFLSVIVSPHGQTSGNVFVNGREITYFRTLETNCPTYFIVPPYGTYQVTSSSSASNPWSDWSELLLNQ